MMYIWERVFSNPQFDKGLLESDGEVLEIGGHFSLLKAENSWVSSFAVFDINSFLYEQQGKLKIIS